MALPVVASAVMHPQARLAGAVSRSEHGHPVAADSDGGQRREQGLAEGVEQLQRGVEVQDREHLAHLAHLARTLGDARAAGLG